MRFCRPVPPSRGLFLVLDWKCGLPALRLAVAPYLGTLPFLYPAYMTTLYYHVVPREIMSNTRAASALACRPCQRA